MMNNGKGTSENTYITVLPLANVSLRPFGNQVVAVRALVAAGQIRTGFEQMRPDEFEFTMIVVEVCMDL